MEVLKIWNMGGLKAGIIITKPDKKVLKEHQAVFAGHENDHFVVGDIYYINHTEIPFFQTLLVK